jgi:cell division protein FtsZ
VDAPSAEDGRSSSEGFSADPDPITPAAGNGTFAGSDAATASAGSGHAAVLSAPVMDDRPAGAEAAEVVAVSYSVEAYEVSQHEAPRSDRVSATAANAAGSAFRPAHAENAAKPFDIPTTRRRPVVFEEDDDLDIPDFLK